MFNQNCFDMDYKLHKGFQSTETHSCTCGNSQNESGNCKTRRIDWDGVLIQSSVAAMAGLQESVRLGVAADVFPRELAKMAVRIGKAMTDELRRELSAVRDDNEKEI